MQHTQHHHPDVIERLMLEAGYTRDQDGQWRDRYHQPPGMALRMVVRRFPPSRPGLLSTDRL